MPDEKKTGLTEKDAKKITDFFTAKKRPLEKSAKLANETEIKKTVIECHGLTVEEYDRLKR